MSDIPFNTLLAIVAGLCALSAVVGTVTHNDRETKRMQHVQNAVQKGSDPIRAGCAFRTLPSTSNVCSIAAATIVGQATIKESDVQ